MNNITEFFPTLEINFGMVEVEFMLEDVEPVAFVCYNLARFAEKRQYIRDVLKNVASSSEKVVNSLKYIIVVEDGSDNTKFSCGEARQLSYNEFANVRMSNLDMPLPHVESDDPAFIIFSSGTTSKPKGIIERHSVLVNCNNLFLQWHTREGRTAQRSCNDFGKTLILTYLKSLYRDLGPGLGFPSSIFGKKITHF